MNARTCWALSSNPKREILSVDKKHINKNAETGQAPNEQKHIEA